MKNKMDKRLYEFGRRCLRAGHVLALHNSQYPWLEPVKLDKEAEEQVPAIFNSVLKEVDNDGARIIRLENIIG
jgi:hypothetical protein